MVGPGLQDYLGAAWLGIVCAQIGLVAIWGVFSSAAFLWRMGICAVIGLFLYGSLAFGVLMLARLGTPTVPARVLLMFVLMAPMVFLAVQLPLWGARTWLRWQVVRRSQPAAGSYQQLTGLKDFIWGASAASVGLSLAKISSLAAPNGNPNDALAMFLAALAGAAASASLGSLPPLLLLTLGVRRFRYGLVGVAIWCAAVVAMLTWGLSFFGPVTAGLFNGCLLVVVSFAILTGGVLWRARSIGYQLRWRKSETRRMIERAVVHTEKHTAGSSAG